MPCCLDTGKIRFGQYMRANWPKDLKNAAVMEALDDENCLRYWFLLLFIFQFGHFPHHGGFPLRSNGYQWRQILDTNGRNAAVWTQSQHPHPLFWIPWLPGHHNLPGRGGPVAANIGQSWNRILCARVNTANCSQLSFPNVRYFIQTGPGVSLRFKSSKWDIAIAAFCTLVIPRPLDNPEWPGITELPRHIIFQPAESPRLRNIQKTLRQRLIKIISWHVFGNKRWKVCENTSR